jgi:multifunctional beta-oxidation protein
LFLAELFRVAGGKAVGVVCSTDDGEAIVKSALDAFGGVHVLVANARIMRNKAIGEMSEQDWDAVIAVLLRSVAICQFAICS